MFIYLNTMDPTIWGPHYWFVIHTIAFHYPTCPTAIQKKIHYRWIHHLPELIPNKSIGSMFSDILRDNPVSPYLDNREDFIKWAHHIHNVVNQKLNKPQLSLADHYEKFEHYLEPPPSKLKRLWNERFNVFLLLLLFGSALFVLSTVLLHTQSHGYNLLT